MRALVGVALLTVTLAACSSSSTHVAPTTVSTARPPTTALPTTTTTGPRFTGAQLAAMRLRPADLGASARSEAVDAPPFQPFICSGRATSVARSPWARLVNGTVELNEAVSAYESADAAEAAVKVMTSAALHCRVIDSELSTRIRALVLPTAATGADQQSAVETDTTIKVSGNVVPSYSMLLRRGNIVAVVDVHDTGVPAATLSTATLATIGRAAVGRLGR